MRKMTAPLAVAATAFVTVIVMSMASTPASFYAQTRAVSSYADDRAEIENRRQESSLVGVRKDGSGLGLGFSPPLRGGGVALFKKNGSLR